MAKLRFEPKYSGFYFLALNKLIVILGLTKCSVIKALKIVECA